MSDTATGHEDTASGSDAGEMSAELERLRSENARLIQQQQQQQQQSESTSRHSLCGDSVQLDFIHAQQELSRCKEALIAMKADRKRLTSEKGDLVGQMKQLYSTLKDKESELRDFIRNYEQRTNDYNDVIKQLRQEKETLEAERNNAASKCQMLTDQLSIVHTELMHKNNLVANLKRLLTQAKLPVDVATSQSSTQRLGMDASHNCSMNDSLLMADDWPSYHDMFHVSTSSPASVAALPRTASFSEARPVNHRQTLLGQHASQLAASLSQQRQQHQQQHQLAAQFRHNSFTGTTSSGVYSTLSSNDSHVTPRRTSSFRLIARGADNKLASVEQARKLPVTDWKASHVLAWLETDMHMTAYRQPCFDNIKSGKILLGLSDAELESALRLESTLHRRKMRLAIEELRDPANVQYPNACKLDHSWVSTAWLDSVGLSQYSASFDSQLVDARLLNVLSRKDLDKHLNVHNKFHQSSILHGVHLLRMMRFDVQSLQERRDRCQDVDTDVIVWTNQRLKNWAKHVDLQEYADKLTDSGVHGAALVLDMNLTSDLLANILAIPASKAYVRRHLVTEYELIVQPARSSIELNKKSTSTTVNSRSAVVQRAPSSASSGHGQSSANDTSLQPVRNSARRLSFKGSLVRALRGRSLSKELPPPPPPSASAAAAVTSSSTSSVS